MNLVKGVKRIPLATSFALIRMSTIKSRSEKFSCILETAIIFLKLWIISIENESVRYKTLLKGNRFDWSFLNTSESFPIFFQAFRPFLEIGRKRDSKKMLLRTERTFGKWIDQTYCCPDISDCSGDFSSRRIKKKIQRTKPFENCNCLRSNIQRLASRHKSSSWRSIYRTLDQRKIEKKSETFVYGSFPEILIPKRYTNE